MPVPGVKLSRGVGPLSPGGDRDAYEKVERLQDEVLSGLDCRGDAEVRMHLEERVLRTETHNCPSHATMNRQRRILSPSCHQELKELLWVLSCLHKQAGPSHRQRFAENTHGCRDDRKGNNPLQTEKAAWDTLPYIYNLNTELRVPPFPPTREGLLMSMDKDPRIEFLCLPID